MPTQQEEGMINKIIKDWVGEEKKEIKEDSIFINYLNGYNQALQDLKSRIPQLTERIVENVIKENDRAGDFHPDCVVIPLYKLKDTLKEGKE